MIAKRAAWLVFLLWGCSSSPAGSAAATDGGGGSAGAAGADAGPSGPLALAPGEVAEIATSAGSASVRIATPAGDEQFVLVLASTRFESGAPDSTYSLGPGTPDDASTASIASGCSLGTDPWQTTPVPAETPPSGTAVAVGDTRTITVQRAIGVEAIQAQAIAVGKSAVVWADVTPAHPANLDTAFVDQFLTDFEDTILPRERAVFGMESDQDKDGHIALVFTPLTYQTAVAFFTGCDLASITGCPASNHGEYLYLTPPDTIAPPYNTPAAIKEILAHECSHLIHFNRKVLRNGLSIWPDSSYLIEGVGGFAQDVVGPQAGNLYVTQAGLDGIDQFSLGDTLVDFAQYDTQRDGVLRGGSYLFVRWLYDRAGSDVANPDGTITGKGGPALMRALLDAPDSVATLLPTAAKAPIGDIATDFYTALAMSNRDEIGGVAPTNPCFAYLPASTDPVWARQRGCDVYAQFHGMQMNGPAIQQADAVDGQLRAGGVEYVEIDATAGQPELDLSLTLDASALPRVRIGRIR